MRIELIEVKKLLPHEEILPDGLELTIETLKSLEHFDAPVWVDENTYVILDGHHRWNAFRHLGWSHIPCVLIDYFDERIELFPRRDFDVTKADVLEKAQAGIVFPAKSTRHHFPKLEGNYAFKLPISLESPKFEFD